jgi:hypothetical protein
VAADAKVPIDSSRPTDRGWLGEVATLEELPAATSPGAICRGAGRAGWVRRRTGPDTNQVETCYASAAYTTQRDDPASVSAEAYGEGVER